MSKADAMPIPLFLIDAFADQAFSGNPAAVCVLSRATDAIWMQRVAAEMAQAETAFVVHHNHEWNLRWFTPLHEVDLCGHATLAAAHALQQLGHAAVGDELRFNTRSGILTAHLLPDSIELNFPRVSMTPMSPPEALIPALGVQPLAVFAADSDIIVEVNDAEIVRHITPDLEALRHCADRGVGITAAGADGIDVVSRFFAPAVGIPEDAATGSLHCALGPYWAKRLRREHLVCYQASARGGYMSVSMRQDRVLLRGKARTVFVGTWQLEPQMSH